MSDIATISLRVNTTDLDRGKKSLDDFQRTAQQTAQQADDLNSVFKAGAASQSQSNKSLKEQQQELQALLNKISPVNRALDELDGLQAKLRSAQRSGLIAGDDFDHYNSVLETTRDRLGRVQQAQTAEGRAAAAAEQATARETAAKEKFVQQLKNQVAAQTLSRTELLRAQAAQLGVSSSADVYIKALEQVNKQTHDLGINSSAARREIGVLVGELARGNFGALRGSGITLANRAGWIDKLLTLRGLGIASVIGGIATAVYSLGKAWYEGSSESEEFNKQLILTGNYAGQTAAQLAELSKQVAASSGVTVGKAAGTLAQVVGSGRFDSGQLKQVATTAAALNDSIGQSVDATIKNFEKLYDQPTKGSAELNKQLHYLTASEYEHISALERSGEVQQAGEEAAKAYATAEQKRSQQVIDNLGTIERLARSASETWDKYWDAALAIGRKETASDQLAVVQSRIKELTSNSRPGAFGLGNTGDDGAANQQLASLREQEKQLQFVIASQNGYAAAQEKSNKVNEAGVTAQTTLNKFIEAGTTATDKRRVATEQLNKAIEDNRKAAVAGKATLWTQSDIDKARAGIEKLYKDPATPKTRDPSAKQDNQDLDLQRQTLALQVQLDTLDKQKDLGGVISKQRRDLLTTESEISVLTQKAQTEGLNQQEQLRLASDKRTLSERETLATLGDQFEQKQKMLELDKQASKFHEQQQAKQAALDAQAAGKSNREAQRDAERSRIKDQYAGNPEAQAKALKDLEDTYKKEDDLRGNWLAGAKAAWNEYYDAATNVYQQVHDVAAAALSGLTGMLDDLVTTGKTSFKSFAASMLKMIAHVIDQLLIAYAIQSALGWISGGAKVGDTPSGAYNNAANNLQFDRGGYTGDGGKYDPAGVVHRGEFVFTKEATAAIGVGNLYAMMKGAQGYADGGYVGRAPMAGMNVGASAGGGIVVNTTVNVNTNGGESSKSDGSSDALGRQLADEVKNAAIMVVRKEIRNGGMIYNFVKGGR